MIRALFIFCAISRAQLEMKGFQHQMYISRKSRANSNPIQIGYVYSKVGDGSEFMTTFDNSFVRPTSEKQTAVTTEENIARINITSTPGLIKYKDNVTEYQNYRSTRSEIKNAVTVSTPKQNEERMKAETKFILEKNQDIEAINQHLKSIMPAENTVKEMFMNYDSDKFRIDDEDVRTASTNLYNGWPYSYHGPYEYQIKKGETPLEKANEKHILLVADTSIIPVHETLDNDIPNPVRPRANSVNRIGATTDNPNYGNQPFFSFVLNDYFDRNNDEYPLIFKDFSWGEEFDHGVPYQDIDDSGRNKRLYDNKSPKQQQQIDKYLDKKTYAYGSTVTEKSYDSNKDADKRKNSDENHNHKAVDHGHKRHHQTGFKDFVDAFANHFGSENLNKESMFMVNQNHDKGEKKKGFRRVYHKDEYQEDNEFYDNTNKNAQAKEIGALKSNIGGSQAVLQSHAMAYTGNEANSLISGSGADNKMFENNKKGSARRKDGDINRYRNIAKNAAQSNSADYIDQYGI